MVTKGAEGGREDVMSSQASRKRKGTQKAAEDTEGSQAHQGPAGTGSAHLAAGAASPSQFGPSPRPQGLFCHQSSCHLRACKRLQQMWGGGRGRSPQRVL